MPNRDGRIRLHSIPTADQSFNKVTQITERVRFQFRFEIFNLTNSYQHNRRNFTTNPGSSNFGTLNRHTVSSTNSNLPRNIQLGFKVLW